MSRGADTDAKPNIVRAASAEFTGVFLFVYTGCASVLGNPDVFAIAVTVPPFGTLKRCCALVLKC